MVRKTRLRSAPLALLLAGALALAAPAAADAPPPPPPQATTEDAPETGVVQLELESLLWSLLSPLGGLLDGEGEEGSSMDPFGAR